MYVWFTQLLVIAAKDLLFCRILGVNHMEDKHPDAESGSTRLPRSTALRWTEANINFFGQGFVRLRLEEKRRDSKNPGHKKTSNVCD